MVSCLLYIPWLVAALPWVGGRLLTALVAVMVTSASKRVPGLRLRGKYILMVILYISTIPLVAATGHGPSGSVIGAAIATGAAVVGAGAATVAVLGNVLNSPPRSSGKRKRANGEWYIVCPLPLVAQWTI